MVRDKTRDAELGKRKEEGRRYGSNNPAMLALELERSDRHRYLISANDAVKLERERYSSQCRRHHHARKPGFRQIANHGDELHQSSVFEPNQERTLR